MTKTPTTITTVTALFGIGLSLLLAQTVHADHAADCQGLNPCKYSKSPAWDNSLRGYGNLNLPEIPSHPIHGARDAQWGPLRKHTGKIPPSFAGSLSRMASSPSF